MGNPFRTKRENVDPTADSAAAGFSTNYSSFSNRNIETSDPLGSASGSAGSSSRPVSSIRRQSSRGRSLSPVPVANSMEYRGFSTSISDMFTDPEQERIDCCAITCCGVLQTDRDRFLLQGVTPPSPWKRCSVHIVMPILIFMVAGMAAVNIQDPRINQLVSTGLILLLLLYFFIQCFKGRSKRTELRKDLLWLKYQILNSNRRSRQNFLLLLDQERPDDEDEAPEYFLGQTQWDMSASHPCCIVGWYADDHKQKQRSSLHGDDHILPPRVDNFCSRLWRACCSPSCCGMHMQLCGVCAIAQEARELESVLLPASYRRIDYISMQSVMAYYPAIYKARWDPLYYQSQSSSRCCCCCPPLSRLSQRLLQSLLFITVVFLAWCFGGVYFYMYVLHRKHSPSRLFGLTDFGVYIATWFQSVGLLALIVWYSSLQKKSELSLDAMIKYFASGFILSTSLAVFWEIFISLTLRAVIEILLLLSGTSLVKRGGYSDAESPQMAWSTTFGATFFSRAAAESSGGSKDFLEIFGNEHPVLYTFIIFINSFLVAAAIEEMCKYFGYRMVEHPDFFSRQELEEASRIVSSGNEENEDDCQDDEEEAPKTARKDNSRLRRPDYSNHRTSFQSQGTAITLAMVSVAMGFTCCENLVYIFKYTGSSAKMELTVLISRSFFPVHPIAAALQSVGVVARDLEKNRKVQLGKILLPAVIFHGCYDFFILLIDFLARRRGVYTVNDDEDDAFNEEGGFVAVFVSFVVSVIVMIVALAYLHKWSRSQRQRLAEMDVQSSVDRSRLI